ncbi:MAG: hypothetical protein HQK79_02955 [Desulfobacterales bacterium]|nr:hypothetical protein [Desulfobacterales bacterium]MBF0397753.1 hypothetical protein [Desulfobacterales bacterium]
MQDIFVLAIVRNMPYHFDYLFNAKKTPLIEERYNSNGKRFMEITRLYSNLSIPKSIEFEELDFDREKKNVPEKIFQFNFSMGQTSEEIGDIERTNLAVMILTLFIIIGTMIFGWLSFKLGVVIIVLWIILRKPITEAIVFLLPHQITLLISSFLK